MMGLINRNRLLFGLAALFFAFAALEAAPADQEIADGKNSNARGKFVMPKLFDFNRYQELFGKVYRSTSEQLIRQKLFLARAFRAFVSGVKYKFGLSSYYLKVNLRSDRTNEELAANKLSMKLFPATDKKDETDIANLQPIEMLERQDESRNLQMMDAEQIEDKLKEIVNERATQPGYQQIAAELLEANEKANRKKRDVSEENHFARRQLSLDDLIGDMDNPEPAEVAAKIVWNPKSNNPSYVAPEIISFGSELDTPALKDIRYYTVISEAQKKETSAALSYLFSGLAKQLSSWVSGGNNDEDEEVARGDAHEELLARYTGGPKSKPDEVYVDHRKSNCFLQPRDQGHCGSCYAFAFTAQLEWLHCKETGQLVQFSEQYIVDCGPRSGLRGCNGGDVQSVAQFAQNFGVELGPTYPYRGVQEQCPYDESFDPEKMGFMRINIGKTAVVPLDSLAEFLPFSPMLVGVATNGTDFEEYGGGVATGAGCPLSEDHAMLLVGHGREEGREYWLLRNSHSPSFGEDGYYKLDKKSGCLRTSGFIFGSIDGRKIKLSPYKNEHYDENLVRLSKRAQ